MKSKFSCSGEARANRAASGDSFECPTCAKVGLESGLCAACEAQRVEDAADMRSPGLLSAIVAGDCRAVTKLLYPTLNV